MSASSENSLDGIWQLVRAEMNGEIAHELLTTNTVLELKDGTYTVRYAGEMTDSGFFDLNETTEIRAITLNPAGGVNTDRAIPGIYQHVGNQLRICYGLRDVRPTEFSATPGQERYLASYRRKR